MKKGGKRKTVTGRGARSPSGKNRNGKLSGGLFDRAGSPGTAETAREFLDAAGGIDEFLLAGEERMTCSADADLEITTGGAHVIDGAAGA